MTTTSDQADTPQPAEMTAYDLIGGADWVDRFTRRFYELMDTLPEAAACRAVHPPGLDGSREKLFDYLTGWLGGPPLYVTKRGHPMLRRRHLVASIGQPEIDGWLACFHGAWRETVKDPRLDAAIVPQIEALARHMANV